MERSKEILDVDIDYSLEKLDPGFRIGLLQIRDVVVADTPQMLTGRYQMYYEERIEEIREKKVAEIEGISAWRRLFKQVGTDPSRYRPSNEALYRRLKKGEKPGSVNSAVDMNNYFSLKYESPVGIYDRSQISGTVIIKIGESDDHYEGLNGREMSMKEKIVSADDEGAFGSPIVDSKRTAVTDATSDLLQIFYFKPSMTETDCREALAIAAEMFTHVHSGDAETSLITAGRL